MADLRIADAPEIDESEVQGGLKIPTGGFGNKAINMTTVANWVVKDKDLPSKGYVDTAVAQGNQGLAGHVANKNNPHEVTKEQVGLGNVDNTADADKPISNATSSALNLKADKSQLDGKADKSTTYTKTEVDGVVDDLYQSLEDNFVANGAALPYDPQVTYNDGAIVADNGILKKVEGGTLVNAVDAESISVGDSTLEVFANKLDYFASLRLHVTAFGVVGDGVADDTQALKNAIIFAEANNVGYLDTTDMKMRCNETINIGKPIVFGGHNSAIIGNHTNTILRCYPTTTNKNFFQESSSRNLELNIGAIRETYTDIETARGIEIWNCHGGKFTLQTLKNHYDALYLSADASQGLTYCEFHLGKITECTGGVRLKDTHNTTGNRGWVTENTFYGGSFSSSTSNLKTMLRYHINFDGDAIGWNNHNVFIKPSFEGWMRQAIIAKNTMSNTFIDPRFEMPEMTHAFYLESGVKGMQFLHGYGLGTAILDSKYYDPSNSAYCIFNAFVSNENKLFELKSGTLYESVGYSGIQHTKSTIERKVVTTGQKSSKVIAHSTVGVLDLDLSSADILRVSVNADIAAINFLNVDALDQDHETTVIFTQDATARKISGIAKNTLGNFDLPRPRANGTDVYVFRKLRHSTAVSLYTVSHNTNSASDIQTITHNVAGNLTIDLSAFRKFYIRVSADVTGVTFVNFDRLNQLEKVYLQFRQDVASNITLPSSLLSDKQDPVSRLDGIDIYEIIKPYLGGSNIFSALSHAKAN